MAKLIHIRVIVFSSLLFVAAIVAAALYQPAVALLPACALAVVLLCKHPAVLLYVLLATIPWSGEVLFSTFAVDVPDEPLMLLSTVAAIAILLSRYRDKMQLHPLLLVVLLQFAWSAFTVVTSTQMLFSFKFLLAKSWYLLPFLVLPLLVLRQPRSIVIAAVVLAISTSIVTVIIFIRHAGESFAFSEINTAVVPFFRNHVMYASLLVFVIPVVIAVAKHISRKYLLLMVVLIVFLVGALYFSYSRGAWLALLIGGISFWLLRRRLLWQSFILFLALSVVSVFWLASNDRYLKFAHDYQTTVYHKNFSEHIAATYYGKDVSTAERYYRWIAGVRMLNDHWMTGTGPASFYENYKPYTVPLFRTWVSGNKERSTVHNYFLLTFIEQGLPAFLLLLVLIISFFWYAQKLYHRTSNPFWKSTVATAAVVMTMQCVLNFLSDLVETDKVGGVFYLTIAVLIIADQTTRNEQLSDSSPHVHSVT